MIIYTSMLEETKTMDTKLVPETVFISKRIWNHVSIYHLYYLLGILNKSIFYNLNIALNYCFISKAINIIRTLSENVPWVSGIPLVLQSLSFFSVITISNHFLYFPTQILQLL